MRDPDKKKAYDAKWRRDNLPRLRAAFSARRQEIKAEVLAHYGNGKAACVRCNFDVLDGLTLDHINDDGAKERAARRGGPGGFTFLTYLRRRGYPAGYQTLCANCNLIKEIRRKREAGAAA